jgi:hypothetical protein
MNILSRFLCHEIDVRGASKYLDWSLDPKTSAQSFRKPTSFTRLLSLLCVRSWGSPDAVGWKSTSSQSLTSYSESEWNRGQLQWNDLPAQFDENLPVVSKCICWTQTDSLVISEASFFSFKKSRLIKIKRFVKKDVQNFRLAYCFIKRT